MSSRALSILVLLNLLVLGDCTGYAATVPNQLNCYVTIGESNTK